MKPPIRTHSHRLYVSDWKLGNNCLLRYVDMAWLGWDAPSPRLLILRGGLRDQIRPGSQIRVRLTAECLRKSDWLGTQIGRRIPYTGGPPKGPPGPRKHLDHIGTDSLIGEKSLWWQFITNNKIGYYPANFIGLCVVCLSVCLCVSSWLVNRQ